MGFDLRSHTHLLMVAGSHAYGLARPGSDVDLKGVAIPPIEHFLGIRDPFQQADEASEMSVFVDVLEPGEADRGVEGSVYDLRKFVRLAIEGNPHVLDVLFCREQELRLCTPVGRRLREHREAFLSSRVKGSFGSYARAQLKRIRGHRRWLLNPPERKPTRADFGLPEQSVISREQLGAAESMHDEGLSLDDNLVRVMQAERAFRNAMREYKSWERWKRERNPARAALEAEFGYDTKHASHLVRLMRMAIEILQTGQVHVWRGGRDADELRAIRDGAWSYDRLAEWADEMWERIEDLAKSPAVPERVDLEAVDALVVSLVREALAV